MATGKGPCEYLIPMVRERKRGDRHDRDTWSGCAGSRSWGRLEVERATWRPDWCAAAPAAPAAARSTPGTSRVDRFKTGASVRTIACSADANLIAVANGGPTLPLVENGRSGVNDNWKPAAEILDGRTGKTVAVLPLTTADEDAVLGATGRGSHFEVTALAFSPDCKVVAVGTSIGQVKIYDARAGALLRLLEDRAAKLADKETPENWKSLARAMGSIASLEFSPDGSMLATCGGSFGDFARVFRASERLDERSTGPGRLKIWNVKTETLKHDLVGHSDANAVAFSPDGSLFASGGSWRSDAETGTGVVIWNGPELHQGSQRLGRGEWRYRFGRVFAGRRAHGDQLAAF